MYRVQCNHQNILRWWFGASGAKHLHVTRTLLFSSRGRGGALTLSFFFFLSWRFSWIKDTKNQIVNVMGTKLIVFLFFNLSCLLLVCYSFTITDMFGCSMKIKPGEEYYIFASTQNEFSDLLEYSPYFMDFAVDPNSKSTPANFVQQLNNIKANAPRCGIPQLTPPWHIY